MKFAAIQAHVTAARDALATATSTANATVQRYDALVVSGGGEIRLWGTPMGSEYIGRVTTAWNDLVVLLAQSQADLYAVELSIFTSGIVIDGLHDSEQEVERLLKRINTLQKTWRGCSAGIHATLTKKNYNGSLEAMLPKQIQDATKRIFADLHVVATELAEVTKTVATVVLPDVSRVAKDVPEDAPAMSEEMDTLSRSMAQFSEEVRDAVRGLTPKTQLLSTDQVAILMRPYTLHGATGDTKILGLDVDGECEVENGYVLVMKKSFYTKHMKGQFFRRLGEYLWADASRGRGWTQVRQQRLFPVAKTITKGGYVYVPMVPYDLANKKFRVKFKSWSVLA